MKIPRDISGKQIIKALQIYGYQPTRQNGSHIRITTNLNDQHHLAIPNHNPVKTGTLNSILLQVVFHFKISKDQVLQELFK